MQTELQPFQVLRPVHYVELDKRQDLQKLLYESMQDDPLTITIEELLDGIESREFVLWTWGTGILVTEVSDIPAGRVLYVTNVRGEGYLKHLAQIDADVESYAKALDCKYMIGEVTSMGLVKYYEKRGALAFHRMLREVK